MDRLPKKFDIRDARNGEWAWVYKAVISDPHLSSNDVRIYGSLAGFDGENKKIFPSYNTIALKTNLSRRSVMRSIKNLLKVEYIGIERGGGRGNPNHYVLLRKQKGCQLCTLSKRMTGEVEKSATNGKERVTQVSSKDILIKDNYKDNIRILKNMKEDFKRKGLF